MRRRSTFVHDPTLDVDPRKLYLSGGHFVIENLRAAREEKLTFGFDELPEEVISLGSRCRRLLLTARTGTAVAGPETQP
jgi:hypothetical protein